MKINGKRFVFFTDIHVTTGPYVRLGPNGIFAISQNYLAKVCINGSSTPSIYDRRYDSFNKLNTGSDAYTIILTSGMLLTLLVHPDQCLRLSKVYIFV